MNMSEQYLRPSMREVMARMNDARGVVLKRFLAASFIGAIASGIAFPSVPTWMRQVTWS